jgi:hypothetical protein
VDAVRANDQIGRCLRAIGEGCDCRVVILREVDASMVRVNDLGRQSLKSVRSRAAVLVYISNISRNRQIHNDPKSGLQEPR